MNSIIENHKSKYPLMEIEDYIKLLFQNEFGPEHLVTNKERVIDYIKNELNNDSEYERYYVESIGNNLCRFHFNKLSDNEINILADLFIITSKLHKGNKEILINKLNELVNQNEEWKEYIYNYIKEGANPIHHSNTFRKAYKPHYRVINYNFGIYFNLISKIHELIETKDKLVIAIDGRCGSGKSYLVEVLSTIFDCNVIHMDDFFIPMSERLDNWKNLIAGNIDFNRLETEVLNNLKSKRNFEYKKYNCQTKEYSNTNIREKKLIIIEGSYSLHDKIDSYYDYKVFLTCDSEIQKERLINRDKSYYPTFESTWIPMEEKYFEKMNIIGKADLIIDNTNYF